MREYTRTVISRGRLAVRTLYGAAVLLVLGAVVFAVVIVLVSATVESSQDRAGVQASIPVAISIAIVGFALAVAAPLVSRTAGRSKHRTN